MAIVWVCTTGAQLQISYGIGVSTRRRAALDIPSPVVLPGLLVLYEVGMKRCTKCGKTKPLEEFRKDKSGKGGVGSHCKPCDHAYTAAWRARHPDYARHRRQLREAKPEQYRATQQRCVKAWKERNPERWQEIVKTYRLRHPKKVAARRAMRDAVYSQKVAKPDCCSICGGQFERNDIHGHHDDYTKPLDVTWMCRWCHTATHNLEEIP